MKVVVALFLSFVCVSGTSLGGWRDLDVNDDKVKALTSSCIEELDAKSNSLYKNTLVRVKSAKVQTVAGWKYSLVFDMGETECAKNVPSAVITDCQAGNNVQQCRVEIWIQPWLKSQQITNSTCIPVKQEITDSRNNVWTGTDQGKLDAPQKPNNFPKKQKSVADSRKQFELFKTVHNKKYSSSKEEQKRFMIFHENMKAVEKLQFLDKGDAKYGATEFADMSVEEFRKTHLTPRWNIRHDPEAKIAEIPKVTPPANYDWRDHNAVTPVKNQGQCGSCWAFSTTGNVEGQWAIKKKQLVSLSEQELVDCDKVDQGCNGGLPIDAYKAIKKLGGLETEKEYPYTGENDKCAINRTEAKFNINSFLNISTDEGDMAAWLYKNGPISIGINAMAMQFYMGGISHPWGILCNPQSLDHGVLIVGYGVKKAGLIFKKETPFWIIKNSWGPSWGEKGYYLLYRGGGVCGVNQMPTSAIIN